MTVMVGFIPTPEGRAALRWAADIARSRQWKLIVVDSEDPEKYTGKKAVRMLEEMKEIREGLTVHGIEHQTHIYVRGNGPVEDLILAAEEFNAELLVIGLRTRGQLARMMLGSHAEQIITKSPCPVLCVKADQAEFEDLEGLAED